MYSVSIVEFNGNLGTKVDEILAFIDYDSAIYFVEKFNLKHTAKPGDNAWLFAMNPIKMHGSAQ